MLTTKQLLELKEEIEQAKKDIASLNGQLTMLLKQLKTDWNCTTLELAEKKLQEIKQEDAELTKQIEKGLKEIEEKYYE
jgi:predicted  nucleic acid-binding Zn-ribbon protein